MADFKLTDEQVASIKKTNPEAKLFRAKAIKVDVVCRPPSREEWRRFEREIIAGGQAQAGAIEQLFVTCCLAPKGKDLEELLNSHPALGTAFGLKCRALAGATVEIEDSNL